MNADQPAMPEAEQPADHAVVEIDNVEPIFVRAMMIQRMTTRYAKATGMRVEECTPYAVATWNTDWPDDPAPRTFEAADEAVDGDLDYWQEG